MRPATQPRSGHERLLWLEPTRGEMVDGTVSGLPALLRPGDLLVLNDSATLPARFPATVAGGETVEVRLCVWEGPGRWKVALFGAGDWRSRTEDRGAPPRLEVGDRLVVTPRLQARVVAISAESPRLVSLAFTPEAAVGPELYRVARPIQYSYLSRELELWDVQTAWAGRPWSVEMPSAGHPLSWAVLAALRERGAEWACLTHAAGISSLGDPRLDALLPFPERYEIPAETVERIARTRARGGRVVAAGTTVVRALEGSAAGGLRAGPGVTDLVIRPGFQPRVVDALLTGMHGPDTSHYQVLGAFAPPATLARAAAFAEAHGYLDHEFGDSTLVLAA